MRSTISRRGAAKIIASLTGPSSRTPERRLCQRTITCPYQTRAVSSTTRRHQQPASAPVVSSNSAPVPRTSPSSNQRASPKPETSPNSLAPATATNAQTPRSLTDSLSDIPPSLNEDEKQVDWTRSYHGLSSSPFTAEQSTILQQQIEYDDIEIKPDGIIYLPEIKYRRILNRAFGPGGWGLAPRGETIVTGKLVTREYGLVCGGRLVSVARGEQQYFDPDGIPTATEGCKSNALMRCCKDLGVASELWDPRFIKRFMAEMGREMIVEHQTTKKRRKHHMRKDDEVKYPFREVQTVNNNSSSGTTATGGARRV